MLLVIATIHEAGHFVGCLLTGIPVKSLHIGIPLGPQLRFRLGKYPFTISLLLLGAAVRINDEALRRAALWRRIVVYLAGPFANFLSMSVVVLAALGLGKGSEVLLGLFGLLGYGVVLLVRGQVPFREITGPVGIVAISSEIITAAGWLAGTGNIFVLLSAALGLFNLLPIPGLDGGRVVMDILVKLGLPRSWAEAITVCFLILLLAFMAIVTIKDIWMLIR